MTTSNTIHFDKRGLLDHFREHAKDIAGTLVRAYGDSDRDKIIAVINRGIESVRDDLLKHAAAVSDAERWTKDVFLKTDLMILYTSFVVMLESRNRIREYEYMDFSRRIGEMWEPFCKECFFHPLTNIIQYSPPEFSDVMKSLYDEMLSGISRLDVHEDDKTRLIALYGKTFGLASSCGIQLKSDLHFTDGTTKWVVDFKSGFGSNEKGNTSRLMLVGNVYKGIVSENYECEMFVRSTANNAYLKKIGESGVWNVSCGSDAYDRIAMFTGFDLGKWISENIDWMADFEDDMRKTIESKNLSSYLLW